MKPPLIRREDGGTMSSPAPALGWLSMFASRTQTLENEHVVFSPSGEARPIGGVDTFREVLVSWR